jgi:hypothetical protein
MSVAYQPAMPGLMSAGAGKVGSLRSRQKVGLLMRSRRQMSAMRSSCSEAATGEPGV